MGTICHLTVKSERAWVSVGSNRARYSVVVLDSPSPDMRRRDWRCSRSAFRLFLLPTALKEAVLGADTEDRLHAARDCCLPLPGSSQYPDVSLGVHMCLFVRCLTTQPRVWTVYHLLRVPCVRYFVMIPTTRWVYLEVIFLLRYI